mgnify:CR=1 FL=1
MKKISRIPMIGGVLLAGISVAASAEEYVGIEEVIVSAERRSESVQKVPIAVTAFSGEDMRVKGVEDIEAIALRTPSLVFDAMDQAEPNIYLRGIGNQNADHATNESPIAIYVDDVYIGRSGAANFDLFDLERVEVLRGPQGTLFGRNASGGVIHIVTQKPQEEFSARLRGTVGSDNRMNFSGMVTGPMTDNLFYKFAASSKNRDGFITNETTGNDLGEEDSLSLRGALRYVPSEDLEVLFAADMIRERGNSTAHDTEYQNDNSPQLSNPAPRRVNALTDGLRERDIYGFQLRLDYSMDWATLTSITAYRDLELHYDFYFAGNPLTDDTIESFNTNIEDSQQFSQEFRLAGSTDRTDWVAGLYYYDVDVGRIESFDQHFNGLFKALGLTPTIGNGFAQFDIDANTKSWAAFAQGSYNITQQLALTAGVRFTKDSREAETDAAILEGVTPVGLSESYQVKLDKSWDAVTPRMALEYQATEQALIYFSATRGFKSGVFNNVSSTRAEALVPLEPEKVWNYELGLKSQWLDNRLRVNAATFFMDFQDLQIGTLIPGQAVIVESASAEIQGLELEIMALPVEDMTLQINYAYLDAEIVEGSNKGNELPRTPENKASVSASYQFSLGNDIYMTPRIDWSYQSRFFHEPDNRVTEIQGSYDMLDASLDFHNAEGTWRVSIWGKNLDDELVTQSQVAVAPLGQNYVTYAPPRTAGVTVTWSY